MDEFDAKVDKRIAAEADAMDMDFYESDGYNDDELPEGLEEFN